MSLQAPRVCQAAATTILIVTWSYTTTYWMWAMLHRMIQNNWYQSSNVSSLYFFYLVKLPPWLPTLHTKRLEMPSCACSELSFPMCKLWFVRATRSLRDASSFRHSQTSTATHDGYVSHTSAAVLTRLTDRGLFTAGRNWKSCFPGRWTSLKKVVWLYCLHYDSRLFEALDCLVRCTAYHILERNAPRVLPLSHMSHRIHSFRLCYLDP